MEEARAATVLIATPATGHGLALKRDLERSARPAFCVNRIAEAAGFFELRNAVSIALVDEAFATTPEAPLLKHLAEQHPRVLRVLISSQDSTMHPLAEEVFAMPWTHGRRAPLAASAWPIWRAARRSGRARKQLAARAELARAQAHRL